MNNSVLVAIAAIGGLWWFSKRPNRNPRPKRYRRNPFDRYEQADQSLTTMDKDNYYHGVLSEKLGQLLEIHEDLGYPYPDPADRKKYAPKMKELQADIAELKTLVRPDWFKSSMKDYNSELRFIKGD